MIETNSFLKAQVAQKINVVLSLSKGLTTVLTFFEMLKMTIKPKLKDY